MSAYAPIPVAFTSVATQQEGGWVDAKFDAYLYKPLSQQTPLKLTIQLGFKLVPIGQKPIPLQLDANGNVFWTSPWIASDWGKFLQGVKSQADLWNNKFWLIPPPTFTDYDFSVYGSSKKWRPNILCDLNVDFSPANPHRTIDVANLNINMLFGRAGPGVFRSHAMLYDSLDIVPWAFPYGRGPGTPSVHYVIAHEIGHAIGLGHIGTLRKLPLCEHAINVEGTVLEYLDPNLRGGRNAEYCYGYGGIANTSNIMGGGDQFTIENARPWVRAMYSIRGGKTEMWRAVTTDPGPGSWV